MSIGFTLYRNPNRNNSLRGDYPNGDAPVHVNDRVMIDSFEYATIPNSYNDGVNDFPLWRFLTPEGTGTTSTTAGETLFGARSLQITANGEGADNREMHTMFNNNFGVGVNDWRYIRETAIYSELLKYNRIRFWMYIPSVITNDNTGWNNLHFGTFLRNTSAPRTDNESDNAHYYHYFDAGHSGGWQQFIIDPHVHHQRSVNQEHGVLGDGHLEAGYNYFDLMTWFYWESQFSITSPATWYVDAVEIYEEIYDEDLDNIYAMNAYKSELVANEIVVRWSRNRNEHSTTYDIKYAFTSFYNNGGWTHGTAAPGGTGVQSIATGALNDAYTACVWSTDQIDLTGQDVIYIALKHQTEATRFRQIAIPLTAAGFALVGAHNHA